MRILYVVNGFDPGGAEHGLLTLVESGAFEGHDLRVLTFCRGRGDLAERIVATLGKRVQFVTNGDTLTIWACAVGFFSILRTAFSFRPQKMVLSLKQANVVGRLAAIFVPRLICVSFEHTAEYRARRLRGVYEPLLRLLSWRVDEIWADCAETLEADAPLLPSSPPRNTRDPTLRRRGTGALQDGLRFGILPAACCCRQARRAQEPASDGRGRRCSERGRRRCDPRRLRRRPGEAGARDTDRPTPPSRARHAARLPQGLGHAGRPGGHLSQPFGHGGLLHRRRRSDARGPARDRRRRRGHPRLRPRRREHAEAARAGCRSHPCRDPPPGPGFRLARTRWSAGAGRHASGLRHGRMPAARGGSAFIPFENRLRAT